MSVEISVAAASDADDLAALHFLSHTVSFAEFASPGWVRSRSLCQYQLQWRGFFESFPGDAMATGWASDAISHRARAWKAVDHSDAVGGVVGMVRVTAESQTEAQLSSMHVHPEHHRKGIGTMLMQAALDFMQSSGFETASLGVIQANSAARRLYERAGWRLSELRPNGIEGVPIATYELALQPAGRPRAEVHPRPAQR